MENYKCEVYRDDCSNQITIVLSLSYRKPGLTTGLVLLLRGISVEWGRDNSIMITMVLSLFDNYLGSNTKGDKFEACRRDCPTLITMVLLLCFRKPAVTTSWVR